MAYRVQWREGGARDGEKRSRTFDSVQEAVQFRGALVADGYRDPCEDPEWAAHLGVIPAGPRGRTYRDVAREYLATLVDADRRTVAEYETALDNHVYEAVVSLPDGRTVGPVGGCPSTAATAPRTRRGEAAEALTGNRSRRHLRAVS